MAKERWCLLASLMTEESFNWCSSQPAVALEGLLDVGIKIGVRSHVVFPTAFDDGSENFRNASC